MAIRDPFFGHALNAVDAKGRVSVPAILRAQLEDRLRAEGVPGDGASDKTLMIAPRPGGGGLRAFDMVGVRGLKEAIGEDVKDLPAAERREALARLQRSELGALLPVAFDGAGRMVLPPMLRKLGRIGDLAFFVGVGDYFEIWSPERAREALSHDETAIEMLDFYLDERGQA